MVRVAIAEHGVSFELGEEWRVDPPWNDPEIQRDHGMYARHVSLGVEIHLRRWDHGAPDREGMRAQLAEQNWPPPPFDVESRAEGGITWAAATWAAPPWVVREWFLTDGQSNANATLVGRTRAVVAAATDAANRLLLSARFDVNRAPMSRC